MSSWYQVRFSKAEEGFQHLLLFWQLWKYSPQNLEGWSRGVITCAPCLVITKAVSSLVFGAKIRGCMWGTVGIHAAFKGDSKPFWDCQSSPGGHWNRRGRGSSTFLANEVCLDQKHDVLGAENSLSRFEVPWIGLALGWCQPKSSNWLVEKM